MASVMKSVKILQKLSVTNPLLLRQATRCMAGWNKDYKPNPCPQTDGEREAAARKYMLLPEEYKPYADDGMGYGDYPKLEAGLGAEARDPYYPYDYPELKRNFNETLHAQADIYGEDRFSQPTLPRYSNRTYWLAFLGVMTGSFVLFHFLENYKMYRPVAVKQLPGDGRKHYTFDM